MIVLQHVKLLSTCCNTVLLQFRELTAGLGVFFWVILGFWDHFWVSSGYLGILLVKHEHNDLCKILFFLKSSRGLLYNSSLSLHLYNRDGPYKVSNTHHPSIALIMEKITG